MLDVAAASELGTVWGQGLNEVSDIAGKRCSLPGRACTVLAAWRALPARRALLHTDLKVRLDCIMPYGGGPGAVLLGLDSCA